ncbi:hypothetical protein HCN44_004176 [Aphidius gifuensis]|uniref:Prophenoloxidase n=1 Tax=Aphidius gifuensis TaxID=684658 RepID=A0A834Y0I1_APHGI|nr:hypothetical protein HCN44_004176 [Aphidius gifuensis]
MSKIRKEILSLFNRPKEPIFMGNRDENIYFNIPVNYLPNELQASAAEIFSRFQSNTNEEKINLKEITLPDLTIPMKLDRRQAFSLFIPSHQKCADHLIKLFLNTKTYDDLLSLTVYCRDRVNPSMFIYCLSVALLHHPETKHMPIPTGAEIFPDKFIDGQSISKAKEHAEIVPVDSRKSIEIPRNYTATDVDLEHLVAYWREDVGINLHHWHWHLVYPAVGSDTAVKKDRRGELFYYMHQQVLARYNTERMCNGLGPVKSLLNLREPIAQGYFPKLNSSVASRDIPSRPVDLSLKDVNREDDGLRVTVADLEQWKEKIHNAILSDAVVDKEGKKILLTEKEGIDLLGNILEASALSVNPNLYGNLHNYGHVAISYCHDPDNRFLESFGVMGDVATAMRDPIFYRWHSLINDLFMEHKNRLPQYKTSQLHVDGVQVTNVKIVTTNENVDNELSTFWNKSDIDLGRGLDFAPGGSVLAKITHLNYTPFTYKITVNNANSGPLVGTCRIFIGPKYDDNGSPMNFSDQKNLMIEMDKFTVTLKPGTNDVTRMSTDSSVTIPFENTFRNLNARPSDESEYEFNFCGCGWPQHMLVPRGTTTGFPMILFVMISDYKNDIIIQEPSIHCADAVSYCGLRDRKYPDSQSMGFPFDRPIPAGIKNINQFLTGNMTVVDVTVKYTDEVREQLTKTTTTTTTKCCGTSETKN